MKRNLNRSVFLYKRTAFKTCANIRMSSQKQPMDHANGGGGGGYGANSANNRGDRGTRGGGGGGGDGGRGGGRGGGGGGARGGRGRAAGGGREGGEGAEGGEGREGGGECSGCSKWTKSTAAASGDEAGTSSGAQTTAEGVLTLGTLDDDALSAIFRSLPVSHDTLQMYANLKAVSKRMLRVTRAQMRNNHLALTLQTVWHRFPGTNIPYRAETVPPTRVVQNQDEYFDWVESDDMQWCAQNGLRVSNSFQCAPGFDAESLEGIDEGDGIIPFFIVVQLNYDLVDILHPSMVPENTGGMADLSRLPNEIRASMGLTGLTVPYDSLVFGGLGDYYRLVQVTQDTTMQAIFDAIAGHEGWNTSTSNLPFNTSTPDVPFDMRLDIDALGENTTVMHTMTAAEELQVRWVLVVDWPSLSTEVVAAGPTTLAETTQVEVVAGDTVAPQEDVGMTYVPPAQQEGAALVYDPVTNEWSYA